MEYQNPSTPPVPVVPVPAQVTLPNSTEALILGIVSIPTCFCIGIFGLTSGIISIVLGNKAVRLYKSEPEKYTKSSYENAYAGLVCGIIGTVLSGLYVLFLIVYLLFIGTFLGTAFSNMPWEPTY